MKVHRSSLMLGVLALALTASMSTAQSGTTAPAPAKAATPAAKTTTSVTRSAQVAPSGATTSASGTTRVSTKSHMVARSRVDLNTASKEDLARLPGIGEDTADRIIAGRPYKSKVDLIKNKILTPAQYAKVRMMVTAKQEVAK